MKAYVFYTDPILECVELLEKSCEHLDDLEIVRVPGDTHENSDLAGQTGSNDYMVLMTSRWQKLPNIIKENMGDNILFIDADIIFNDNKKDFVKNINLFLEDNDLVTQYDNNSHMSLRINMGFLGIKCNEKNFNMFLTFTNKMPEMDWRGGYPQLQFNDYLKDDEQGRQIKFKILPEDSYGFKKTNDCYFYHAINVGHGTQAKVTAMKNALQEFEQFR